MTRTLIILAATGAAITLAGCGTWVGVQPAARDVTVLNRAEASHCQQLGKTTTSVDQRAGVLSRNPQAVDADLVNLARNDAAKMHGNAVAPIGSRSMGHQSFGIYRCGQDALTRNESQPAHPQQKNNRGSGFKTTPYEPPQ